MVLMLHRLINMKDIELYEIKEMLYSDVRYYMLLLDYHRPSRYEDFSFIPNYEEEDFESRGNFMAAYILYDSELTNNEVYPKCKKERYIILYMRLKGASALSEQ